MKGLFIGLFGCVLSQRRFDIGMWCGVPTEFLSQSRIDQIAAAGFTLGTTPCNEPANITYNKLALQYASKTGCEYIVPISLSLR